MESHTIDPPFLPYNCRHNKHTGTGPRHHTPSKHSMRGRACAYPPVEQAPEIVRLHLGKNASVWRAPLWLRLWKYGFRSVELKVPHWECLLQGFHPGPPAWGEHWGMVALFVHREVLFHIAMKHNSFFTCRNSLEVFCPLIP